MHDVRGVSTTTQLDVRVVILDFRFWIESYGCEDHERRTINPLQSKIENPKSQNQADLSRFKMSASGTVANVLA